MLLLLLGARLLLRLRVRLLPLSTGWVLLSQAVGSGQIWLFNANIQLAIWILATPYTHLADLLRPLMGPLMGRSQPLQFRRRPQGVLVSVLETERVMERIQDSFLRNRPQRLHRLGARRAPLALRPCTRRRPSPSRRPARPPHSAAPLISGRHPGLLTLRGVETALGVAGGPRGVPLPPASGCVATVPSDEDADAAGTDPTE